MSFTLGIFMLSLHSLVVSGNSRTVVGSRRSFIKMVYAHLDQRIGCYLESITTGNKLFKCFLNISKFSWECIFQEDISWSSFRYWWVHKTFSDALERLLTKIFMSTEDSNIISQLKIDTILQNLIDAKVQDVLRRYIQVKLKGLNGDYGKTPQYWLTYIQMVSELHLLHFPLKVNNFELKIKCWEKWLSLCFTANKIHYSHYGTFYVEQMKNLKIPNPGLTEEIEDFCLRKRNSVVIRQAIDSTGEQTYKCGNCR